MNKKTIKPTAEDLKFFIQIVVAGFKMNPEVNDFIPEIIVKTYKEKFKEDLL